MLQFALKYWKAIDKMTEDRSKELQKYELSDEEWEIAEQLRDILKIFNDTTLYFSRDTPSLPMVIPAMDIINEHLTDESLDAHYQPCIRAAIGLAKKTLNHYYSKTDQSSVYRIAMVLHSSHKLQYFKRAGWEQEWIDTAETVIRDEFKARTHTVVLELSPPRQMSSSPRYVSTSSCAINFIFSRIYPACTQKPSLNMFDNLLKHNASKAQPDRDEITRYLDTETEDVDDALVWWYARRK
ncbi:hypothetical protein SCP_0704130 [Sparassis crispa]|uniref:HAT C-terminal dimerisation domain-containing protein n=1 Tax=Sparassis crispa TaxID=139825 RepID=A0A401GSP0_9APHY|nr:hypothetical protein SCP_0704130 [Sparassis crispa]GBE85227.1 hypothetical protein SCP_0704130 [Sparassis crispa]